MNIIIYATVLTFVAHTVDCSINFRVLNVYAAQLSAEYRLEEYVNVPMIDVRSIDFVAASFEGALLRVSAELDEESKVSAKLAINQAQSLLSTIAMQYRPLIGVTEDGIAIIQWRYKGGGIALLFDGNNSVTLSERTLQSNYTDSSTDYDLGPRTGAAVSARLKKIYF